MLLSKKIKKKKQLQSSPHVLHGPEIISNKGDHLEFLVQILTQKRNSSTYDVTYRIYLLRISQNESWTVAKSQICAAGNWVEGPFVDHKRDLF